MGRAKKRADRIRAEITIIRVLSDYNYNVNPDGDDREQQFQCDLHGDGTDGKPSARAYPSSNSWFCFACGRPRDAIQTCREKEGLDFWGAVKALEKRYHLPDLPWDDDEEVVEASIAEKVHEILKEGVTREDLLKRVRRRIEIATNEREVPMEQVLKAWEDFDRVVYGFEMEQWTDGKGFPMLIGILAPKVEF
jgi:DNA primase